MIPRFILLLTLAGCAGYPDVPDPRNPVLTGTPKGAEPEGQCFAGPDTARIRVLCEADLTPDLRTELQRALAARGLFAGKADGKDGPATREAVRRYQALFGRGDPQLTWPAAEALGLVAIPIPPPPPPPKAIAAVPATSPESEAKPPAGSSEGEAAPEATTPEDVPAKTAAPA